MNNRFTRCIDPISKHQGSLRLGLQGYPKILNNFKYRKLCSARTRCTSQCGTFQRDAAGPHPGAGKYRDSYTSQHNIGCAAHKDDIGDIKPGRSPHRKTNNSTRRERLDEKSGLRSTTDEHGHRASRNLTPSDPTSRQD